MVILKMSKLVAREAGELLEQMAQLVRINEKFSSSLGVSVRSSISVSSIFFIYATPREVR